MDEKSSNLVKILSKIYSDQEFKTDALLKKTVEECARPLMGNNDDKVYFEVITKLTHGFSKYYSAHHKKVPDGILKVYQQIKVDIPKGSINADKLKQLATDTKMPFMRF